jgi:chemotaxis-related protein WspD
VNQTHFNLPMETSISQHCWNQGGIWGEASCPELAQVVHCHNCSVYTQAGRRLLEREAPPGYVEAWTALVTQTKTENSQRDYTDLLSVFIFRLGAEWLALPSGIVQEATRPNPIHTVPHRSDRIFLGLVNVRGALLLCISLRHLLGIEDVEADFESSQMEYFWARWRKQEGKSSPISTRAKPILTTPIAPEALPSSYIIVVAKQGASWVFPVDEIAGIHRFPLNQFQATPAVINQTTETYSTGIVRWQEHQVNYLDDVHLFTTLDQKIL